MSYKIAASILAADFTQLGAQVREAEAAKVDLFHLDVMDGDFVPNISFGPMVIEAVNQVTDMFLDVHLMIERPERYLEVFAKAGADQINVHIETCPQMHDTIQQIRALNVKVGIAINPETPFEKITDYLDEVDRILVMTIHPGFGGQKLMPEVLPKMKQIAEAAKQTGRSIEIGVDGGVDKTTIAEVILNGGTDLVAGTSIFRAPGGIAAGVAALREAAR